MARATDETVVEPIPPSTLVQGGDKAARADAATVVGPPGPPSPSSDASSLPAGSQRSGADTAAPPGTRVGSYVLEAFLADGGFGVVYRARHADTGEKAAVKILHPELASTPDLVLRFEREVEAIRRVMHPNVIAVHACGRLDDGRPYFAMELLRGSSLEEHLRARGRLSAGEALAILEPLASALSAAHERSIVHRDIKASNVFLSEGEAGRRVVLLDFGVAKLLDDEGPALTRSRHVVGTLACMAPEQLLGRPVDARTDVYALGALTFCMLTGEQPFADSPFAALHQMHLHARPPRVSSRARVSPALDEPILQAMSKDPAARFPTADAFVNAIRSALSRAQAATMPEEGAAERPALGVYVEVLVSSEALESADEQLLSDMESILPAASSELSAAGFSIAVETGTSLLLVLERPAAPAADYAARRAAIGAVVALSRKLASREGRDPRVRVFLCVHAGDLVMSDAGTLVGGGLLELASWVPEAGREGVFASAAATSGLGLAVDAGSALGEFARLSGAAIG